MVSANNKITKFQATLKLKSEVAKAMERLAKIKAVSAHKTFLAYKKYGETAHFVNGIFGVFEIYFGLLDKELSRTKNNYKGTDYEICKPFNDASRNRTGDLSGNSSTGSRRVRM